MKLTINKQTKELVSTLQGEVKIVNIKMSDILFIEKGHYEVRTKREYVPQKYHKGIITNKINKKNIIELDINIIETYDKEHSLDNFIKTVNEQIKVTR